MDKSVATNEHLDTASIMMVQHLSYYAPDNTDIFLNLGFSNMRTLNYKSTPTKDTIGATFAKKVIDDQYVVIPVIIRGSCYYAEWANNFFCGESGDAKGFIEAAQTLEKKLKKYVSELNLGNKKIKFWVMGHSRAGAVANILSKNLSDEYGMDAVYGYTFAAPSAVSSSRSNLSKYKNIKNYICYSDMVPLMYPDYFGLDLYGQDITFGDVTKDDYLEKEAKVREIYDLMYGGCSDDEGYISPLDFSTAKIDFSINGVRNLISGMATVTDDDYSKLGVFKIDKQMNQRDYYRRLIRFLKKHCASSRKAYVNDIPQDVIAAAEKLGIEACSIQQALIYIGNTYYSKNGWNFRQNLVNIPFDSSGNTREMLSAIEYIIAGGTSDELAESVDFICQFVNTETENYQAVSSYFDEEECRQFKAGFLTIFYYLSKMADEDTLGTVLETYLYQRNALTAIHSPYNYYCWLRIEDSFYDQAYMPAVNGTNYAETGIWAKDGSNFENVTIKVFDKEGSEIGTIENGTITSYEPRQIFITATKDEAGKNREFSIHTLLGNSRIEIEKTGGSDPSNIYINRYDFKNNKKIQKKKIISMDAKTAYGQDITLYTGQKVEAVLYNYLTKVSKDIDINLDTVSNSETKASFEFVDQNLWTNKGKVRFSYPGEEDKCIAWFVNGKLISNESTFDYDVNLQSQDLEVTCKVSNEHNFGENYTVLEKAGFNKAGKLAMECSNCEYAMEEADIPEATVKYKESFVYTGKTIKAPKVTIKGPTKKEYTFTKAKTSTKSKNIGRYYLGTIKLKGSKYSGSKKLYYYITPKGTSLKDVKSIDNKITVSWKKQTAKTTGYEIAYASSIDFSDQGIKLIKNSKTTSATITGLTDNKTYYIKARTYKNVSGKKIYSSWSTVKSMDLSTEKVDDFVKSLPKEYQAVEYVENQGRGLFHIPVGTFTNNFRVKGKFVVMDETEDGSIWSYQGIDYYVKNKSISNNNNKVTYWLSNVTNTDASVTVDKSKALEFCVTNQYNSVSGKTVYYTKRKIVPVGIDELYIFDYGEREMERLRYPLKGRLYYLDVYTGKDRFVLIPCYKKESGEVGLYDVIHDHFYSNAGADDLVAGPEIDNVVTVENITEASAEVEMPKADIFSLGVDQDDNFYNIANGEKLVEGGNVEIENTDLGKEICFDGESYLKFEDFDRYYDELKEGFTFEFYGSIKAHRTTGYTPIFGCFQGGGLGFEGKTDGRVLFYVGTANGYTSINAGYQYVDEYYHLVATYDGTVLKLWVNGIKAHYKTFKDEIVFSSSETANYLCFAGDANDAGTGDYLSKISIVAANIYSKALTQEEILKLYSQYK